MIGRNDPCTCGSGKKYKRCCLRNNEVNIDTLIEEELGRVLRGIYEETKDRSDIVQFERYRRQWVDKLNGLWDEKSIGVAVTEYYLFAARQDLWKQYLQRVLTTPLRDAVRSIVETWEDPVVLFGKITGEEDGYVKVKEVLGEETFYLEVNQEIEKEKDVLVFGVGLRNPSENVNGIYMLSSFMFIKDINQSFEQEVVNLAEASQTESDAAFYKEHMLDIYHLMLNRDNTSIDDLINSKLDEEQQKVLEMVEEELSEIEVTEETQELVRNISITYLLKEQPRFRKPNVIAAALFSVVLELQMLGEITMPNSEVAKRFDVSTSSINTHKTRINTFVTEMLQQSKEK